MSKQEFIENLNRKRSNYSDPDQAEMAANLLDTVSTDIYSESERFVFELIQNADDSAKETSNKVHFDFLSNCLVISHTGKPFDEDDIKSLTGAGSSTKKNDPTKTGYKGIGFKSVFGKSNRVTIFSDGYQFRFDKAAYREKMPWQIIPIWTADNELKKEIQDIVNMRKASVFTILEINKTETLLTDLLELLSNGQILLFLRRISKISVANNGKHVLSIEKKAISEETAFNHVALFKDDKQHSTWLVKTFGNIPISEATKTALKQDEKTPEKLKGAALTEISFAARIDEGKIRPLKEDESLIFTYLPTKFSGFKFPFLVNGSFLTNAAREALHEDRVWNQWLMSLVAEKIIEWLTLFAETKHEFQILSLLPEKFGNDVHELKRSFDTALLKAVRGKAFIPSIDMKLKKPVELIIDRTGLSALSFISPDTVIEFINKKDGTNFTRDAFIHPQVKRMDKLRSFNAKIFDADNLDAFFGSPIFQSKHEPKDNYALIEYFFELANKEETSDWGEKLKELPFIFAEGNSLKSPQAVCFPSIAYKNEFGAGVTVIHNDVYKKIETNNKVKKWLETMGVKEPSDTSYLENEIIGNIENCVTEENFLRITTYLFNQHKKNNLTELHYKQLQKFKLSTTTKELIPANQCFLSDVYEPSLKLEKVNSVCKYVSETYKQTGDLASEWKTFLLKISVSENIELHEVKMTRDNARSHYREFMPFFDNNNTQPYRSHGGNNWNNSITEYILTIYSLIEFAKDYEFSKLFWEKATAAPFIRASNDRGKASWQNKNELDENFFDWCINNAEIFPSTQKKCVQASELFINDKDILDVAGKDLPVFDHQYPLSESWKKMLPFKLKLELEDYLTLLEKLAEQAKEDEAPKRSDLRRIGLIYNKLATLLPNFSTDKKEQIAEWARANKLLCANGKFEPASELKWISIEGFSTVSGKIKTILLPENSDKNSASFKELMSLLQVQTISKFTPQFDEQKADATLKPKLQEILPYLVAVIEKKKLEPREKEFDRIYGLLNPTAFYTASEIKLTFTNNDETIAGSALTAYHGEGKFCYKGKWRNERTLFSLIEELSNMLGVAGLDGELRYLLLETDPNELRDWLTEKGIDLYNLHPGRPFIEQASLFTEEPEVHEPAPEVEPAQVQLKVQIEEPFEPDVPETFEPKAEVEDIDVSSITFTKKAYTGTTIISDRTFAHVENQKVREDIGLWSEKLVNKKLVDRTDLFSNVVWMNENGESGLPYDFHLVLVDGSEKYADVKGTPSDTKDIINLSANEWVFMFEKGANYSIYRVYNAGNDVTARIEEIENPSSLLQQGKILPNPITLQI